MSHIDNQLIVITDIKKEFVTGEVTTKVLHGLTFTIDEGDFVAIMGPSGSGKSTLMHILGLLDTPTSGSYEFKGESITERTDDELARTRNKDIGFVFQAFYLLPKLTVLENVKLPLQYANRSMADQNERATAALESVGLGHRVNYYPNQISGGEKQRVAIARALVNDPSLIFADEPTGNLDSKSGLQVMSILQKLNDEGKTIIVVTHETYTSQHAKRIIHIKDGLIDSDKPVSKRIFAKDEESLQK